MIKMQNVRKVYPGFDFELSMEIPEGRITGLIGKNGAGKSTAIRLMLGLAKADGGIIELFGKPITEIMAEDRQNIGVSLAESGFNGQFTIVEVEKILAKMYPKFEESCIIPQTMIYYDLFLLLQVQQTPKEKLQFHEPSIYNSDGRFCSSKTCKIQIGILSFSFN